MDPDVDTFLTTVYDLVDTAVQRLALPPNGARPHMSHSEVLTLVIVGQWRGSSARALVRWAREHLADAFPILLSQSAFNRRVRHLGPVCAQLMQLVADHLGAGTSAAQVLDCTAVPLARQCRGEHHRLFADEAGIGRGGSDRKWFYGARVLLAVSADGAITGLVVGPAPTQDRWLADALLTWRVTPDGIPWTVADIPRAFRTGKRRNGPTGPRWWPEAAGQHTTGPYLVDAGFLGRAWIAHWEQDTGARVLGAPTSGDPAARRHFHGQRQIVETINGLLHEVFHLDFPLAKTMWGVVTRIVVKCTACNLATWLNRQFGRPPLVHRTLVNL